MASLVFLVTLPVVYFVHARYFHVDVVFYSALLDAGIAVLVAAVCMRIGNGSAVLGRLEQLQLVVIWVLIGYVFAISVPTVIDRSLSFYLLEKLDQRGGGIRRDAFEGIISHEFMHEYRLVDSRLTEQEQSGTLRIEGNCVVLTDRGRRLAGFSRWFRLHLLPRQRLLMGQYSDDLTDPFRRSPEAADYRCVADPQARTHGR